MWLGCGSGMESGLSLPLGHPRVFIHHFRRALFFWGNVIALVVLLSFRVWNIGSSRLRGRARLLPSRLPGLVVSPDSWLSTGLALPHNASASHLMRSDKLTPMTLRDIVISLGGDPHGTIRRSQSGR